MATFEEVAAERGWGSPGNDIERTVARLGGNLSAEDIEDIAMEVTAKIWAAWDTIEKLDAVIRTTAKNQIIDQQRKEAARTSFVERDEHRNVILSGDNRPRRGMLTSVDPWYLDGNHDDAEPDDPTPVSGLTGMEPSAFSGDTYDIAPDAPEKDLLYEALDELPDGQREAIELRYFEGLSVQDIAIKLETTPGAVSVRINAALKALRTGVLRAPD